MTTTKTKTSQMSLRSTLALVALGSSLLLAQGALADTLSASRSRLLARCSGALDVKVIDWAGQGPAIYVYESGHLVTAQWVDKSVSDDGRVEMTSYKTDASVFDGGVSLRIRSRDDRIPATEGTAWLTTDGQNPRLACSVY